MPLFTPYTDKTYLQTGQWQHSCLFLVANCNH
jgi:hypothetical protein